MITTSFAETAGSCGIVSPNRGEMKTPLDKIRDAIKTQRQVEKTMKELEEIDAIKAKSPEDRTLEEKIKLANYYGKVLVDTMPKPEPKYMA